MSYKITKDALKETLEEKLSKVWQSGGAGREALKEELKLQLVGWTFAENIHPLEVEALIPYKEHLYAHVGPIGKIYKFDGYEWSQVWSKDEIPVTDPFHPGWYAAMWAATRFKDGRLYFGGEHFQKPYGRNIILAYDGETFELTELGGYDTNEIVSLYHYGDALYAGERAIGGRAPPGTTAGWLWRSYDGVTWERIWMEPGQRGLTCMEQYGGDLYIGTEENPPSKIYRFDGSVPPTEVLSDPEIRRFKVLGSLRGKLWCGALTTDYRFALFSYDGSTWNKIVFDFYGEPYGIFWAYDVMLIGTASEFGEAGKLRASGRILAFDGVRLWEVLTLPSIGVSRIAPYAGTVYFGTLWETEPTLARYEGRRVGIYRLDPKDFVYPLRLPPRTHYFYDSSDLVKVKDKTIGVGGFTSCPIPIIGFRSRTVYLLSDQGGTIDIEIDQFGDGDWQTYISSDTVTANTLYRASITGDAAYLRISFTPSAEAAVTAKLVLS